MSPDQARHKRAFRRALAPTLLLTSISVLCAASCATTETEPPAETDTVSGDPIDTCGVEPTLDAIQDEVFLPHCSFGSCHGNAPGKGDLLLTPERAYEALLLPVSTQAAAGKYRVVPGEPDASFIVHKMTGQLSEGEGVLMPKGRPVPLDDCKINLVRAWVMAGARNN